VLNAEERSKIREKKLRATKTYNIKKRTRNSAITDKPRDAFMGQSRSPNMVPFHMLWMISYYCPIVTLSVFEILDLKMP